MVPNLAKPVMKKMKEDSRASYELVMFSIFAVFLNACEIVM